MSTSVATKNLTGAALDWAVAKCEGHRLVLYTFEKPHFKILVDGKPEYFKPSINPAYAWPIIDRIGIATVSFDGSWSAYLPGRDYHAGDVEGYGFIRASADEGMSGPTSLVAAMRCYVESKLGDTVDVPQEFAP